jgi:hypothetical protein
MEEFKEFKEFREAEWAKRRWGEGDEWTQDR